MIIDTNRRTTSRLGCLRAEGVETIIRYYARTTRQAEKRLTRAEADAIVAAGASIAVVHQAGGASAGSFSRANGELDAEYALTYAIEVIGQPAASAIYFAVDFDCNATQFTRNVVPHFEALNESNQSGDFSKRFVIGAYGNGLVLDGLLTAGLCGPAWLSQSTGHHGSKAFKASNRWTLFQGPSSSLCGIGVDVAELNPEAGSLGQFDALDPVQAASSEGRGLPFGGSLFSTTAAAGLRLRAGPGTDFEVLRLLPPGTIVAVLARIGDWAIVDVDEDGLADGAVHTGFLAPAP